MANQDETKEIQKAVRAAAEDAVSYPILTEEVSYAPSPLGRSSGGMSGGAGGASLGQMVTKAMSDVLGWKLKAGDTKGFVGALTQSFILTEVDGHTESKWTPRTYAVQTDLSGGITGPQASVYSRAKEALDQSLPLLEGLYALYPDADGEDVTALKAVAKSQLTELVKELGMLGGPRVSRVNQYFNLLLGDATFGAAPSPKANTQLSVTDPDKINGTLGTLRDKLGLNFSGQDFVNSVDDEQDLSNFRILSDYVTSLAQSWINNLSFFGLNTTTPFFGTQLVLLSRQLSVVAESVDEVRFTLDSVFIGQAERQTLRLNFGKHDSSMYLEDLLSWIQSFASEEGPRLIQDGGKFGVQNTFLPIAQQLLRLVQETSQSNSGREELPRGFHTSRVQRALTELKSALHELVELAKRIQHVITPAPDSELALAVTGVERNSVSFMALPEQGTQREFTVFIRGNGFRVSEQTPEVEFTAILPGKSRVITVTKRYFQSENLLVATLTFPETAIGLYDVKVTNPDEKSATLSRGFTIEA